ncbi:MAG TPA: hypothetical protein VFW41_00565 [Gaiellaceae bacterium]|jgi:hypothetical protein|nr:hypothetical protein [Gaiellaceae bacterium]
MATEGQDRASQLTALPKIEDIPRAGDGLDADQVREAFDAFRRHVAQLQAQLRVLQAAGNRAGGGEPSGHAVRMDALHLIRAAAEFADTIERDAQTASAGQLARTEQELVRRQSQIGEREAAVERQRQEVERQRAETINAARNEARELLSKAQSDAARELQEAEARGTRLLEQSRHQATELTNAARAEVEQTLDWARNQARVVIGRAQQGAEQLLAAAGLGQDAIAEVAAAIMRSAEQSNEERPLPPTAALAGPPAEAAPEPPAEPEGSEPSEPQP